MTAASTDAPGVERRRQQVHDRDALFAALAHAVSLDSPSTVFIVVGFEGLREYLLDASLTESDQLLERLGQRLVDTVDGAGSAYASRRGEFCALCECGLDAIRPLLTTLMSELDDLGRPLEVRSSLGVVLLPDEAPLPTSALALADRRIRALSGDIRAQVK